MGWVRGSRVQGQAPSGAGGDTGSTGMWGQTWGHWGHVCHPCHIPRGAVPSCARARLCPHVSMSGRVRALSWPCPHVSVPCQPVPALSPPCHRPVAALPSRCPHRVPSPRSGRSDARSPGAVPAPCPRSVPVSPGPVPLPVSLQGHPAAPPRGVTGAGGAHPGGPPQPPRAAAAPRAGAGSNINRGGLTGHRLSPIVPAGPGGSPPRATPRHKRGGPAAAPQSLQSHHEQPAGGECGHGGARGAHLGGTDTSGTPQTPRAEETPRLSLPGGDTPRGTPPQRVPA